MGRSLVGALVALTLLAGCADAGQTSGTRQDDSATVPSEQRNRGGQVPGREPPPAVPRKVVGGVGESAHGCELPVRFMMTGKWNPRPVKTTPPRQRADLISSCEIHAPSGPGMLRVWIGDDSDADPRAVLETFMAASTAGPDEADGPGRKDRPERHDRGGDGSRRADQSSFARLVADDVNGWQVTYPRTVDADQQREVAFVLPIPDGVLLVSMGPLPAHRYDELLPVYVLAKTTVKVTN